MTTQVYNYWLSVASYLLTKKVSLRCVKLADLSKYIRRFSDREPLRGHDSQSMNLSVESGESAHSVQGADCYCTPTSDHYINSNDKYTIC